MRTDGYPRDPKAPDVMAGGPDEPFRLRNEWANWFASQVSELSQGHAVAILGHSGERSCFG